MIESETKASLIIKNLERINADMAQLERFLIKEDRKLAEALCSMIARIFWEIEVPVIKVYPSLQALAVIGEQYKKCHYRVGKLNRKTFKHCMIKSGIPPEDATSIFAKIKDSFPKEQDSFFYLDIENCIPPEENWQNGLNNSSTERMVGTVIESKVKAAFVVKELERIRPAIERQVAHLLKEDKKFAEPLCKTLGTMLTDLNYPILRIYPSLRPIDILGEKYKNCKYNVAKYDKTSGSSCIVESGIPPEDSAKVLAEIENKSPEDENSFFCLELEGY